MNTLQKNRNGFIKALILCTISVYCLLLISFAEAATQYVPIVGIPGLTNQNTASLPDYINRIYFFTITIGAMYGVVKIAFAGVKYSMSDIITSKESAKEDIKGVLLGLAILLIPFIVLRTINPELTRLDVLSSVKNKIPMSGAPATEGTSSKTAEDSCKAKGNTWYEGKCCAGNIDQCLAVKKQESNPASKTVADQWQFVGVSRDFCTGKAKETNMTPIFTQTSMRLGKCDLYPN